MAFPKNLTSFTSLTVPEDIDFALQALSRLLKRLIVPRWILEPEHLTAGGPLRLFLEVLACNVRRDVSPEIILSFPPSIHTIICPLRISTAFYLHRETLRQKNEMEIENFEEGENLTPELSLEGPLCPLLFPFDSKNIEEAEIPKIEAVLDIGTISFFPKNTTSLTASAFNASLYPLLRDSDVAYNSQQLSELLQKWQWPNGLKKLILKKLSCPPVHARRLSLLLPSTLTYLSLSTPLSPNLELPDTLQTLILSKDGEQQTETEPVRLYPILTAFGAVYKWPKYLTTLHDHRNAPQHVWSEARRD